MQGESSVRRCTKGKKNVPALLIFPRHVLKVKHRGGEHREVTHDRNTNANWTGKMDLEG